jgi:hypothetical protein
MNRPRLFLALAPVLAVAVGACGLTGPDTTRRTLEVAPHKAVCVGLSYRFCLLVREPGRSAWEFLYETPRGLAFEWGVTTRIVIEERELDDPPQDASSIVRTLVRTEARSRVPADSIFSLLIPGMTTAPTGPGSHRFTFGAETLHCDTTQPDLDCDGLAEALVGPAAVDLRLALGGTSPHAFRVVAWRACGAPWPDCPEGRS